MSADFLLDPGTSGFIATPFNLQSTELNALTNGSSATSSVGGTSGVYTPSNFANAQWWLPIFIAGGAFTPTAGGAISGWFLYSDDTTHFEKAVSNTALPRPPDFVIPLFASAYASADRAFGPIARAPWPNCKILLINNAGATLPATGNLVMAGPVAERY